MRIVKSLIRIVVAVVVLGLVGVAILYHLSTRTPDDYNPLAMTAEQRAAAAQRLEVEKIPELVSRVSKAQASITAAERAQQRGAPVPPDAAGPLEAIRVTFTQDELNAFLWKWSDGFKSKFESYFTRPYIHLDNGQIVLMGTITEYNKVLSLQFEPSIDAEGMLHCELTSVRLGNLPIPQALFGKLRDKVQRELKSRLPEWQRRAKLDATGATNDDAISAALSKLLLQMLDHKPSPAMLFLRNPVDSHTTTVRLTEVAVERGELTLVIKPLDAADRAAILRAIREPLSSAPPPAPARNLPGQS